jgi:hypothetical protein
MRASRAEIIRILNEAETNQNLPKDTLVRMYEAEERVVFMRRRGSILKDLRGIIVDAAVKGRGQEKR